MVVSAGSRRGYGHLIVLFFDRLLVEKQPYYCSYPYYDLVSKTYHPELTPTLFTLKMQGYSHE